MFHRAFVPVIAVLMMQVPVVDVIQMVTVGDGSMSTVRAVHMRMAGMGVMAGGRTR